MAKQTRRTKKTSLLRRYIRTSGIILGLIFALTAIGLFFFPTKSDKTILYMTVDTPTPQTFTDTNNVTFMASNTIPDINNNRQLTQISPITINYHWIDGPYAPAFAMGMDNNEINKYVKISPLVHGKFSLVDPNTIKFTPDAPWPADTKFTVRMSKKLFANNVLPDTRTAPITTPDITATLDSFNVYPSPDTPQSMVAVAVVSFTYPINTDHFSDKITIRANGKKLNFSVKFDKFHRTAFIISDTVPVMDTPQNIRMKINRISALNGNSSTKKITANTTIDARDNFFRVTNIESIVADDTENNARQLILVKTSTPASKNTQWSKYITAYLLPQYLDSEKTETNHIWQPDQVTPEILAQSKKLKLAPAEFASPMGVYQYAFAYNVPENGPRSIYIDITPGAKSMGDFTMQNAVNTVMPVAYPEKSVHIAGSGAILSMSGDKTLGIMTRGGVDTAYINLYKIKSSEINHLISQTYNVFASDIEFKSWSFGTYDMSLVFEKRIPLHVENAVETNYASLNLGDYMDRVANDKTGIFVIQAAASQNAANFSDRRLILVTDLGIIRKTNLDGSSVVFISNISTGMPAMDVEINVLGRNGNAIWAGRTDAAGRADIPAFPWNEYKNARQPVAIVARDNNDVSFIPYDAAYAQRVEYSKFDIDGAYSYTNTPLNAYTFSDRGIYRPGEEMVIGTIIKNKSFKSLDGVPVRVEIMDARGQNIFEKNISLKSDGMFDIKYTIPDTAPIGKYSIRIYSLNVRATPVDMIGTTTFSVSEFSPDTMKITANILGASENGWVSSDDIRASVNLQNLFGTPAANREIRATGTLRPIEFTFDNYKHYKFDINNAYGDTTISGSSPLRTQTYSTNIKDVYTSDNGTANMDITFDEPIPFGTYLLTTTINGYESNSGKSVQTTITSRVSNAKYLVGYHTASDLGFIKRNTSHTINFIALDHTAEPINANDLTMRLVRRENLTSLIKDYNNYYKYQTTTRDTVISQSNITINKTGFSTPIISDTPGTYFLQILDAGGKILSNIEYFVTTDENTALESDKSAQLNIKLDSAHYNPGDKIYVNITAPYSGYGLITIERDNIYAYKWFRASTTNTTQHIEIPSDFEGTGYVNVSFVRASDSRDIFTSPYAFAVSPFQTNIENRTIDIELNAPKIIRDNKLEIQYRANKSGRMMIFAINEGILQVARYQTPNPLQFFFRKSALQVETFQILSLILPEYKILREFAKTGGGDFGGIDGELAAPLSNPFARRTAKSVAFYSGLIDITANKSDTITFEIPDNFNGALRIFAIASNESATGAADITTTVQSPLVISMNAPTFVAPNDKFDINASVTNLTDIGDKITVDADVATPDNVAITSGANMSAQIPTDAQHLFIFSAHALDKLGPSEITVNASAINENGISLLNRTMTTTLSVRPTTPFETNILSGTIDRTKTTLKRFSIDMYPQMSSKHLYLSTSPAILLRPLFEYLSDYEFTCTEQMVSRTIPYVLMPHNTLLGTNYDTSAKKISETINTLKNRQNPDGSFNLWSSRHENSETITPDTAMLTTYVTQFLTIARQNGFNVPDSMLGRAVDFLRAYAGTSITDKSHARAHAYAIYVITSNGYISTSYIDAFREYADKNMPKWESEISGTYIAASFQLMQQSDMAHTLFDKYRSSKSDRFESESVFENNVSNDAMHMYIGKKLFNIPVSVTNDKINNYLNSGHYDAYTAAHIVMGLAGADSSDTIPSDIKITSNDTPIEFTPESGIIIAPISNDTNDITIKCPTCTDTPLYYTIVQRGFTTSESDKSNGIDMIREYFDVDGNRISASSLGDTVIVKITARARSTNFIPNIAIVDLLPGGFIAEEITGDATFSEIREDRVIIYTDLSRHDASFTYRATPTAAGEFAIPQIWATSMYNPEIFGTDSPDTKIFNVINVPNN